MFYPLKLMVATEKKMFKHDMILLWSLLLLCFLVSVNKLKYPPYLALTWRSISP